MLSSSIRSTLMLLWFLVMIVLEITSYTPRLMMLARRRNLDIRMLGGNNDDNFPIDGSAANSSALSFFGPNRNGLFKSPEEMIADINDDEQLIISKGFIPSGPLDLTTVDKQQKTVRTRDPKAIKYFEIVEQLAPNEMLQKFATTAPQHVQAAAKSTILSILGSLPSYALDANVITTSSKLANLLYQMQMTGYMFKNAEYRMSLARSLKGLPRLPAPAAVNQGNITFNPSRQAGEVIGMSGEVQVSTITGDVVTVDVNELTGALSQEVESLRSTLALIRDERESELRANLLTYIQGDTSHIIRNIILHSYLPTLLSNHQIHSPFHHLFHTSPHFSHYFFSSFPEQRCRNVIWRN